MGLVVLFLIFKSEALSFTDLFLLVKLILILLDFIRQGKSLEPFLKLQVTYTIE